MRMPVCVFLCACMLEVKLVWNESYITAHGLESISEEINCEVSPGWSEGPARAKVQTDELKHKRG